MLKLAYDGKLWGIDTTCTPPLYRVIGNGVQILFEAEWKGGSYFKIKSVTRNNRTYQGSRYHLRWIQLVREATFQIYKTYGLWDYKNSTRQFWRE